MGWIWRAIVNAIAIVVAAAVIPGITWGKAHYGFGDLDPYLSLGLTGLALGVVNAFVRPIFVLVSLPVTCLTLGLFLLVINAAMLWLVAQIPVLGFGVSGFLPALVGSIVISVVSFLLSRFVPD